MKNLLKVFGIIAVVAIIGFAGCDISGSNNGGDDGKKPGEEITGPVALTGVTLSGTITIPKGDFRVLTPYPVPSNAALKAVTWATSDASIATVDTEGKVTAVKEGEADITVTTVEEGFSAKCKVTVVDAPDSIQVTSYPVKTQYRIGEPFIIDGLVVKATYEDVQDDNPIPNESLVLTGFNSSSAGDRTITVTYRGRQAKFTVTVSNVSLSSIELSGDYKTAYFVGDEFDPTNLVIMAKYSDDEEDILPISNVTVTGFNTQSAAVNRTVTITYGTKTATFTISVTTVVIVSIEVTEHPAKITYSIGETLNIAGIEVTAYYNSGKTEVVSVSASNVTGFSSTAQGVKTLTVTYQSITTTFDVIVIDPASTLSKLEITAQPGKTTYYQGEELDLSGMEVTGTWTGASGFSAALPHNMLEITGYNPSATGEQTIYIDYGSKSAFFTVTVQKLTLVNLTIPTEPAKKNYNLGEALDLSGISVRATYNSGDNKFYGAGDVNLSTSGFESTSPGKKTVTVTFKNPFDAGDTKTAIFEVDVHPWTVTFDSNGGDTEADPATKTVTTQGGNVGSLPTTNPTKAGWTFAGWNTHSNGSGTAFTASTPVNGNITVYAQWVETYIVTFNNNGGNTNANPQTKQVVYPATTIDALPTAPTKDGWIFTGWNTLANGSGITFAAATTVTNHITVYAQWVEIFIVTFDRNGGTSEANPRTISVVYPATTINTLPQTVPTRNGYTFINWNSKADGSGETFTIPAVINAHRTVYAQWKANDEVDFGSETVTNTFDVSTVGQWNTAVSSINNGSNNGRYIINITAGITIPRRTTVNFTEGKGVIVSIRTNSSSQTIYTSGTTGNLLRIGASTTVILRNIRLAGGDTTTDGNGQLVYIDGGSFILQNGGEISGNTNNRTAATATVTVTGSGVYIASGSFTMNGGKISNNTTKATVERASSGTSSAYGGGVYMAGGTFTMNGGEISGNTVTSAATISGSNPSASCSAGGGGVYASGTFNMNGGVIFRNSVYANNYHLGSGSAYGGGVSGSGTKRISNGIIYGNTEDASLRNIAAAAVSYPYGGASLYGTAQLGTWNGETWNSLGTLSTTNDTIHILNGIQQ